MKLPLMNIPSFEEDEILKRLHKDDVMLEFGAGGSTLHFSNYVKKYNSIEHVGEWATKVKDLAEDNTTVIHAPCYYVDNNVHCDYDCLEEKKRWSSYFEAAKLFEEKYYNKVFIDGRARAYCAIDVLKYIDKESIVFIHDYGRMKYHKLVETYYNKIHSIGSLAIFRKKD